MRRFLIFVCAVAVALAAATHSRAYQYTGFKWPGATTAFSVDIPGANGLWNTSFENAMAEWNSRTVFIYTIFHQYADPCSSNDGKNGVAFGTTVCGTAFGSSTLAVTRTSYFGQTASDTGIIFNSNFSWSVYTGPWQNSPFDFKRVAVHELGHALGLDHETNASAIMAPTAGFIEVPQTDDINGVNALYGASTGTDVTPPALTITSHTNAQTVTAASITIAGTATDSGAGDNGISAVTVNGAIANGGLATGAGVANWSKDITLNSGSNLITVVASDSSSNHNATTRTITINLSLPLSVTSPSTLTNGAVGGAYSLALAASGGTPSYSWSITAGSLPPGLTLSSAGVLSGTPTSAGTYNFTVRVTDSVGATASKAVQLAVTAGGDILLTSKTASPYHVFPQFADGFFADRTYYRSTLIVTNTGAAAANCTLQLYGMTFNSSSSFSFSVATVYTFRTNGAQSFQRGYATLQCASAVEAEVVYSFYASNTVKLSEATVFSSPAAASLRIVSDSREGSRLGLAIANDTDQNASYTVRVYDNTGNPIGTPIITLGPRQARSSFLDEFVSLPANHYGIVDVVANNGTASMIGLRFTGSVFTTIPATMLSAVGAPSSTYHVFPQFADGFFSDRTYYRSTMIITNAGPSTSCTLQLYGLSINNSSSKTFAVNVPAASTFSTSGLQSFQQGYATLRCAAALEAQVVYSFYSSAGVKLSEATVFSSPSTASLRIISDAREGERLGLAIANDSDLNGSYTIRVYDANGAQIGSTLVTLGPRQARAAFLDELTTIPIGHYGVVDITTNSGTVSMIGLRFTGSAFTTIPAAIR